MRVYSASIMSEDYDHVKHPDEYARFAITEYKKQHHAGLFKI